MVDVPIASAKQQSISNDESVYVSLGARVKYF